MADLIEILLVARDLASGNISRAADKIEADLGKAKAEAALTGTEFDRMGQKIDRSARGFERPLKAIDDLVAKLPKATTKVGDFAQRVSEDMAHVGQQLDINFEQMAGLGEQLTLSLDKAGTEFGKFGRQADGIKGKLRDAGNAFRLMRGEIARTHPELNRLGVNLRAAGAEVGLLERALGRGLLGALRAVTAPVRDLSRELGKFRRDAGDGEAALTGLSRSMTAVGSAAGSAVSSFVQVGQALAGIGLYAGIATFGVQGIAGAVLALTGPTVGLAGALSTLSASFVALPAGIFAAGGALAAFMGVIKPATSAISQYIAAQSKASQLGTPAGSSGGGGSGTSAQDQIKSAEIALKNARINAVQSIQAAEASLQNTRRNALLSLMSLEQRLANLRQSNAQKQAQLEAAVQDARAAAATETSGGRGDQALAAAFVGEAQGQLSTFQTQARGQENQLISQIARQQIASDAAIQAAEDRLKNARINAAQSIASAERNLALQRKQAAAAAASDLSTEARLYQNLTPLQKQVADQIIALKDQWHNMGVIVAARNSFLKEILRDLQAVRSVLPQLGRDTAGFANVITRGIGGFRRQFVQPGGGFTGLGARVFGGGPQATGLAANGGFAGFTARLESDFIGAGTQQPTGLLALIDAITRFTTSAPARGFLKFLETTARDLGTAALASERLSESGGGLARFFGHAQSVMTLLGHTIRDTFDALKRLGSLAFPTGQGLLKSLADAAKHFRQFTENPGNADKIKRFFREGDQVTRQFGHAVGVLAGALGSLGGDAIKGGNQSPLARFFKVLADIIPQFADGIRDFTRNSGPALLDLLKNLGPIVQNLGGGAGSSLGLFVGLLNDFLGLVIALTGNKGIADFVGKMALLAFIFRNALGSVALFLGKLVLYQTGLLVTEGTTEAYTLATQIAAGATTLFGLALEALPWVALVAAIVLVAYMIYKHWGAIVAFASDLWDKVSGIFSDALEAIVGFVKHHWKDILAFLLGPLGFYYLIFKYRHELWDKIKDLASSALDFIRGLFPKAISAIVNFLTNTAPSMMRRAWNAVWGAVQDVTLSVLNGIIGKVADFVNGIIGAVNWVLDKIGAGKDAIGKWNPPVLGGGSATSGGGGGGGGGHGRLGPTGRGLAAFDQGGTVPGPVGSPQVILAHGGETVLPTHKQPIGKALTSAVGIAKSVGGSILGGIESAGDFLLTPFLRLIPDIPKVPGFVGTMVKDSLGFVKDKVISWGKDKLGSITSVFGGGTGGQIPPLNYQQLIRSKAIDSQNRFLGINWGTAPYSAALHPYPGGIPPWNRQLTNDQATKAATWGLSVSNVFSQANLAALLGRARQESGWMSAIINQWDSNWKAGIPSVGFLQEIGGTFTSHALKPFLNIWDPLHQAISAVRYMLSAYGHIVGPSSTGYDIGGVIGQREGLLRNVLSANRSIGSPIRILAHVGEWVLNPEQQARVARAFGGLENAKAAIFQGKTVKSGGYGYAAGGIVTARRTAGWHGGGKVEQHFTINTTSPKVDIDYIARLAESRMAHLAEA